MTLCISGAGNQQRPLAPVFPVSPDLIRPWTDETPSHPAHLAEQKRVNCITAQKPPIRAKRVGRHDDRVNSIGKNGAQGRSRTTDTAIFSRMLYQLSYLGNAGAAQIDQLRRGIKSPRA